MKGFNGISGLIKITEDELDEIMNDFDPIEAPPGPYTLQPNKKGKFSRHIIPRFHISFCLLLEFSLTLKVYLKKLEKPLILQNINGNAIQL